MQTKAKVKVQVAVGPLTVAIMLENVTVDLHNNASVQTFQRPCFVEGMHQKGLRGSSRQPNGWQCTSKP